MPRFVEGQRYPMTRAEADTVLNRSWPVVTGIPDLSRGRRFRKAPCDWEFWTTDGRKVEFSFDPGVLFVVSQSKEPDPDRPEPFS